MILMSNKVQRKIAARGITEDEIYQCFESKAYPYFATDSRAEHQTTPPTNWFIASTLKGRILKVVFMEENIDDIRLKTAYEPNQQTIRAYENMA